ncbi:unnamed protein product [Didymodactylos carnosus]|uniref:Uncharacterized protein n=1 Tax=Didymodactylos carnosus TaxID=1234261 RepID=A0A8S2KG76_9BILA|nr:unnamed protein product [Didymodactylos carnosus]CAF3843566.1 unnamed protein product [Didymodactylos carnosus]
MNIVEPLAENAEWVHESSAQVQIKLYHGHTGPVNSCQLVENKNLILTGSNDNTARLWEFNTGKQLNVYQLDHHMPIPCVKMNHDASRLYSCSWDKTLKCFDMETAKEIWKGTHEHIVTSCNVSHTGNMICSGTDLDGILTIWDPISGKEITTVPKTFLFEDVHDSTITSCQFNTKDDRVITTSADKTTKFYDLVSRRITITLRGHENVVSSCSFNKLERLYATCSWDKTILLWDAVTGPNSLPKLHEGSISSCFMSDDSKLLVTGSYDLRVVLWDVENMTHKLVLRGHKDWINDVCLTSDNKWIISVSNDCDIRLWNIKDVDKIKQVAEQYKNMNSKIVNH